MATVNVVVGSQVWVEDPEVAWMDGEVLEIDGENIKISCANEKKAVAHASRVYVKDTDAPPCGVDDMTKLTYLHEPGVLQNLKSRYELNEIYTYTGSILIAVNPFRRLSHLYDHLIMERYKGAAISEQSPHPFAIAEAAYRLLVNEGVSQSILVSGESGAGKTESTKMLMRYLAYMGGRSASEGRSVEQQVLESNPVLEAFGNAKTVRNNNSSRFGKFVEIQFDHRGRISGAAIRTYLLERSRVCQVSDPERNYHCFYMLCAAPPEDIEKYRLGKPCTFHYLNQSNCYELEDIDDSKEYQMTRKAMDVVGISYEEQDAIFRTVAAVLHLGNIEFAKGMEVDSSEPKDEKSWFHLKTAAELFMCDVKALEDSLCKRVIVTRDESITKTLDPEAAALSRDALAKIVYSQLFDWLVNKINNSIGQDPNSKALIGVLDIYGFESFKTNSFEQFCINLTNEKLQQHFNQHVFKMEQEQYIKEEIDWSYIEFIDNRDVLDLIEKKPGGILALLDEACMFPRSTHETFAEKLYQTFKNHNRFSKPKLARTDFTISHYAGDVTYQTELFLDKNKDYVVAEHQALLSASECSFVSSLFPPLEDAAKATKFASIGTRFKQQLQALLETLSATEPHYIRCVKPNSILKPAIFENHNVLQQLRCGGVMEAIRISCAGYPTRQTFVEFVDRFGVLCPEVLVGSYDDVSAARRLLEKVDLKGYQIGKTKLFLRAGQMAELDALRSEVLGRSASIIQRRVRSHLVHRKHIMLRWCALQIQAVCRGQLARQCYGNMRREAACLSIQRALRTHLARKTYKDLVFSAVIIQAGVRAMAAHKELKFRRQTKAAIVIQSHSRPYLAHLHFIRLKKAAIILQCAWRSGVARSELCKRKMAARETGALQAAKDKLEKQVEELTRLLHMEKSMRVDMEEAKTLENAQVQSKLQEMQLQLTETKALLVKEQEAAKRAVELTPVIQEVLLVDTAMEKLTAENEKLKAVVSSLEMKIDETEKKFEETYKLSEERLNQVEMAEKELEKMAEEIIPIVQEAPVFDTALLQKLTAENEKLKVIVSSLEEKIDETEMKYEEINKLSEERLKQAELLEREAARKAAELPLTIQEVSVVDTAELEMLTAENEKLTAMVNSFKNMINEMEKKYEETRKLSEERLKQAEAVEQEAARKTADLAPILQEIPIGDTVELEKLSAENEQLKAMVNSLEKKVDQMEKKYEEARELSEEWLKQAEAAGREHEKKVVEFVPIIKEIPIVDTVELEKLTAENEKLKAMVNSLKKERDEYETKYQETHKLGEEGPEQAEATEQEAAECAPLIEQAPAVDTAVLEMLTTENEILKAMVSSLRKKINETEEAHKLCEERLKQAEAAKQRDAKTAAELIFPVIQKVPYVDTALLERFTAENENFKAMVNSLEKKIVETGAHELCEERLKEDEVVEQRDAKTSGELVFPVAQEAPYVDTTLLEEVIAENEKLKAMVTSLEKMIIETEEARKLCEERLKQADKRQAAKMASELVFPVVQEVSHVDAAQLESLTAENEKFKAMVNSLEMKIVETGEEHKLCKERLKQAEAAERQAAKMAAELVPVIEKVPDVDSSLMEKLTAENEKFKALVNSLEEKIFETEKKYEETRKLCEEKQKQADVAQQEAAKKATEPTAILQEATVVETAILEKLTTENDKLKAMVGSLEEKIGETEKKYEETYRLSQERLKQTEEAESKIIELKTAMQRIEEKLSDLETEDQILRQQVLSSPVKSVSEHLTTVTPTILENDHHENEEHKTPLQEPPSAKKNDSESNDKLSKSLTERQHEIVGVLIKCVMQNIGFSQGKPIAAVTIYKCLLHWKSFEAEKTSIFDNLVQMIGSAIEHQHSTDQMAYWLSNTSVLLFMLQRSLATSHKKPQAPTSLFGRMTQGFRSSSTNYGGLDVVRQVEAKYPALLFKQQLTAYVEKICGIIRDKLKKDLQTSLSHCVQVPRIIQDNVLRSSECSSRNHQVVNHWQSIIERLNTLLQTLQGNFVPSVLTQKIFTQVFSYINLQLFNSLLLRCECCNFQNGEFVKTGLAELELWCTEAKEEYAGTSWDELKHTRQAVGFLVGETPIHN